MKKVLNFEFKSEVITWILVFLILGVFLFPTLNFQYFSYFTFFIPIKNIIALILFLLLTLVKNLKKINMIIMLNRFELRELIFSYSYYGSIFVLFLLVLYLNYLGFLLILVIIILEVMILITNYYAVYTKKITRDIAKYIKVKEVVYCLLMVVLFLGNYPFKIYNIPMNVILAIVYALVQVNVIYKMYN